jgi:hypothetical protein
MPCAPCGMPLCAAGAERGESKGVYAAVSERGGTAAQRSRERGWWRCAPPGRQPCTARALARLTARNETLDPPPAGARPGPHGGKQVCERAAPTLGEVSGCREAVHRTPRRPSERSGGPPPGRPQGTLRSWPGLPERGAPVWYRVPPAAAARQSEPPVRVHRRLAPVALTTRASAGTGAERAPFRGDAAIAVAVQALELPVNCLWLAVQLQQGLVSVLLPPQRSPGIRWKRTEAPASWPRRAPICRQHISCRARRTST